MSSDSAIDRLFRYSPFQLSLEEKSKVFNPAIHEAFSFHMENNDMFRKYCTKKDFHLNGDINDLAVYPYLPVNIFKNSKLFSVPEKQIKKYLRSSATSGVPSTIVIDDITSKRQSIASASVISDYIGKNRQPFLILDEDPTKKSLTELGARSAATRGFLMFANSAEYFMQVTNQQFLLDVEKFKASLDKHIQNNQPVCIFGFTFVLYSYFIKKLDDLGLQFQLPADSKVLHIGGWKKLESQKVSKELFLNQISEILRIEKNNIIDFYGFTEQMGIVYANAGNNPKTVPLYAEVIIRDFNTLESVKDGEDGLIQILTPIPHSYPGISVLTEDVGRIVGRGKDSTGRYGTQFEVVGRAQKAEARGCGDILAEIINQ